MNKAEREVRKLAREFGREIEMTKGGHWKLTKAGCQPVVISQSVSDWRGLKNARRDLRNYDTEGR